LVKSWKTAWERKRLSAYIAHYHPGFVGNGRNLQMEALQKPPEQKIQTDFGHCVGPKDPNQRQYIPGLVQATIPFGRLPLRWLQGPGVQKEGQ